MMLPLDKRGVTMPGTMAKKKKPKGDQGEGDRSADRHRLSMMAFRPPADVRAAIEGLASRERRSVAQVLQFLVEEALQARGLWQPADAGEENGGE
jgi:hypothetical protein